MSETTIENAIIRRPDAVGYAGAGIVRNARVSLASGRVDLMLLPASGPKKIGLVEVKRASSKDAAANVIGQLIMYYAAALQLGDSGIRRIKEFASAHAREAQGPQNTSLNRLAGAASQRESWRLLQEGPKLKPHEIDLFLAMDGEPRQKLMDSIRLLNEHHALPIRIITVAGEKPRLSPAV